MIETFKLFFSLNSPVIHIVILCYYLYIVLINSFNYFRHHTYQSLHEAIVIFVLLYINQKKVFIKTILIRIYIHIYFYILYTRIYTHTHTSKDRNKILPGLLRTIPEKSTISAAFSISLVQHTYLYPFLPHLASFLSWTTNDGQSQLYTCVSHCPQSNSNNLYVS